MKQKFVDFQVQSNLNWGGNVAKKVFFVDTSVLIHDPGVIEKLSSGDNTVVLSIHVLYEIDKSKKFQDDKGLNSRMVSRKLDKYRENGRLSKGVKTESNGTIVVDCEGHEKIFEKELLGIEKTVDNRIIASALAWKHKAKNMGEKIIVVSKDINLRVASNAYGIFSEDFESDKNIRNIDELYTGLGEISLPEKDAHFFLTDFPRTKKLSLSDLSPESNVALNSFLPNQCLVISIAGKTVLAIYKKKKQELTWVQKPRMNDNVEKKKDQDIFPKNIEQAFEYALLCDDDIPLVAVVGNAGTGKTLISILAATDQLDKYNKIIVYRPNIEMGKDLGFLPGDVGEKFSPFTRPILDNLELVSPESLKRPDCNADGIPRYFNGRLEIHPINFIRGRSINNAFVIVDEAQNLTRLHTKSLITRAGYNTKFVLTGDCTQIDSPYLDAISNGLAFTVEILKGREFFGSIMLRKSERSDLVEMVARLM